MTVRRGHRYIYEKKLITLKHTNYLHNLVLLYIHFNLDIYMRNHFNMRILIHCLKSGGRTVKFAHTLWVVDATREFLWTWVIYVKNIFVMWNLNIINELQCREMYNHFPPLKKHTKNHEERVSEIHYHLHWWHFYIHKTLFSCLWIKLAVSNMQQISQWTMQGNFLRSIDNRQSTVKPDVLLWEC